MAGREKHVYPDPQDIIDGCRREGTFEGYARTLGIAGATLRHHCKKHGILQDCNDATRNTLSVVESEEVSEAEILRAELLEARQALRKDRKGEVQRERITRGIEHALSTVPPPSRAPKAKLRAVPSDEAHHRQLTAWSDWHGGEIVDPDAVNGLNEYSWDIM